jgi:hypothetical protein
MKKILSLGLLVLLSACAKDKSVDDYQRDKLQKNLALYESVAGSYSGIVTSEESGDVMGAMELRLRAEVTPVDSKDGETSVATPILVGSVRFLDQNVISLSAPNGYYDPATGLYSADIKITRAGGNGGEGGGSGGPGAQETETVKITGYIGGDALNGTVHALDYPGHGGRFQLVKNRGDSLQEQLRRARPGKGRENGQLVAFSGTTYFRNVERPVHIVALRPSRGTAEDFLDLVNPVKKVQLSLNYSNSLQFLFQNAIYDTRQGYITGELSVTVGSIGDNTLQKMNIECSSFDNELRCSHVSSGLGQVATSEAKRTSGPLEPLPDAPEDRQSVSKTFYGKGRMPSDKKDRTMELRVVYPARTRRQALIEDFFPTTEKLLQVSVVFVEDVSQSFSNVKWDTLNGLLDGSGERSGTSGNYTAYVQCHNFFFLDSKEKFSCNYWTTRSALISMEFTPPYRK